MTRSAAHSGAPPARLTSYWERAQRPLPSLLFLLPLLLVYELGALVYAPGSAARLSPIWAESLLTRFFEYLGVSGYHLPALAVVLVLLSWHLARGDPWQAEWRVLGTMALESIALAIPLFMFMLVLFRDLPAQMALGAMLAESAAPVPDVQSWQAGVVTAIGAGIYEELVFRLIAIAALHMLLVDLLSMPQRWGAALAIGLSTLAFALQHFTTLNVTEWLASDWAKLAFYLLAGLYFAGLYMLRGFGIAAGAHAVYDVLWVGLMVWQGALPR